jgi:hypothetical protein
MPRRTAEPEPEPVKSDTPDEVGSSEPNESTTPEEDGNSEPVQSIGQLIELSEQLSSANTPHGTPVRWAFRGQSQDFGTLVPSFQRQFTHQYLGAAEEIERRLIDAFRKHYAKVAVPGSEMPAPPRIGLGFDLRCLSVMQHYEIPTRLLDWTGDFWTAVYFACASDPTQTAELWYYDRGLFEKQRGQDQKYENLVNRLENVAPEPAFLGRRNSNLIIELDFQITPRMDQQQAHHTVCTEVFSDHVQMIEALAKQVGFSDQQPVLHRDLIDASAKGKVLQYLADKGMTASTIFPDVVGLGRFLKWQFESLRTMLM